MRTLSTEIGRVVTVRLNRGEDLLESTNQAVRESKIQNGLVLAGVGSVSQYRLHVVKTTNMPPGSLIFNGEGPYDILSLTGLIIDGRIHAHVTLSDAEQAIGGHLEEGCKVLSFAVVVFAETPNVRYTDWDKVGEV